MTRKGSKSCNREKVPSRIGLDHVGSEKDIYWKPNKYYKVPYISPNVHVEATLRDRNLIKIGDLLKLSKLNDNSISLRSKTVVSSKITSLKSLKRTKKKF